MTIFAQLPSWYMTKKNLGFLQSLLSMTSDEPQLCQQMILILEYE